MTQHKSFKQYRIAITDDHQLIASALKSMLEADGRFLVDIVAHDGQELIDKLESQIYVDAILIDINMPVLNGIEATKLIKAKWGKIIIIALTAYDGIKIKQEFMNSGGDLFLNKFLTPEELIENLITTISGYQID